MAAVYVHLSGKNIDDALLKLYGIKNDKEEKESTFKPKECFNCAQVNQASNRFCLRCGIPLDKEAEAEILKTSLKKEEADRILDGLLEDSEFREVLVRKLSSQVNLKPPNAD